LSFDVPDILRTAPGRTCWPLIGTVILTPCNTEVEDDDGICDVDAFDVVFALGRDDDDDGCNGGWTGSCNAFFDDVTFVLDVFDDDDDGIIGNCGNAD
jgi:hypothetical protein